MSILFSFNRSIPKPFDDKSKIVNVSSKYGDGTKSTLTTTVMKAVMAYCDCQSGLKPGAIGVIDTRSVAEYKSSVGPEEYHLVVFDPIKGQFIAACYNSSTELIENYTVHKTARDGAALIFAMMPELMKDDEFREKLDEYKECHMAGWPDVPKAKEHMAILCDNVYRRVEDSTCEAHVKVNIEKTGNIFPIRSAQKDAGVFAPKSVVAGEFTIFAQTGAVPVQKVGSVIEHEDFIGQYIQTYANRMESGYWFPEKPTLRNPDEIRNEADLRDYISSSQERKNEYIQMAMSILNILEDGYIESKMLDRYPGKLGMALKYFREQRFTDTETLTQQIEKEDEPGGHIWRSILQLILSYVILGEMKYGEEPLTDERVQAVFSLLPVIDKALVEQDFKERLRSLNIILVHCWTYIRSFLEMCEEMAAESSESSTEISLESIVETIVSALSGISEQGSGDSASIEEMLGVENTLSEDGKRKKTAKQAALSVHASDNESEEKSAGTANPGKESGGDENKENPEMDSGEYVSSAGENNNQDVKSTEGGRIKDQKITELSIPIGGSLTRDEEYKGLDYENAAADIERVVENMAEKVVHRDEEKRRTTELNSLANDISYGDIHEGVNKRVRRIDAVGEEMKEQFVKAAPPLLKISKRLQKSIIQQLKDRRRGGKQTNLYTGRKLYMHALPRNDGRAFYNKKLPNDTPELAIALLLDESGSMNWNDRATYARSTAIILYDFCQALGIPIMVYGHSTDMGIDLYSYAEFDAIDHDDKYRMMDISARGSNRDGAALRYVMDPLSKRPEDIKLLIIVSDGQPADSGYGGSAAEADLRGIKKDCERKGILLVAAAIGDDKECIERIYGDGFMDITDLEKMPQKLTQLVKRHISM